MKAIIQKWLHERAGSEIQMENLGKALSDGVVFAKLLNYYHVVNKKTVRHISPSDNPKVCENNLNQLAIWFNLLNIKFDNDIISSIINGKITTCLKLLYELFVALHDKPRLQFINIEKDNVLMGGFGKKFSCDKSRRDEGVALIQNEAERTSCESLSEDGMIAERNRFEKKNISSVQREDTLTLRERMRLEDIRFVRTELNSFSKTKVDKNRDRTSPAYRSLLGSVDAMNKESLEESLKVLEGDRTLDMAASGENLTLLDESRSEKTSEREQLKTLILSNILQQSEYEKQLSMDKFQNTYEDKKAKQNRFGTNTVEEPIHYFNFFSTCKTSEEEISFQLESIQKVELHRKLYDDKIRKRNKRRLALCQQTVKDLVDLAIKISEYGRERVTDILWSEWKELFILGKPLLEEPDRISDTGIPIVQVNEVLKGDEEAMRYEDFDDYNHLVGDWFIHSGHDISYDDLYVIAHIVYRLQDARLPQEVPIKPADIPRYRITSAVNGSFDELTLVKLKTLLFKSKVFIIDVQSTINYCVERYKIEADIKPPEPPSKKGKKQKGGTRDTAGTAKSKTKSNPPPITFKDEEVQTGSSLFDIDKPKELSDVARMGMQLYGLDTLTDLSPESVVSTLIAFLKSQSDIEGWVMVNFPSTLTEAYNLEKTLTGKKYPQVFRVKESGDSFSSQNAVQINRSKLVHLPFRNPDEFNTYLTSFINVIQRSSNTTADQVATENMSDSLSHFSAQAEETREGEEEEVVVDLNTIYKKQGVLQNFYFEQMDLSTLKKLVRVILKYDGDVERTPSNVVFGEHVIEHYEKTGAQTPITTSTKSSKRPKNKKIKSELDEAKEFLEQLNKETSAAATPKAESVYWIVGDGSEATDVVVPETVLLPGQNGWNYAKFPIFEGDAMALADIWEAMEAKYIKAVEDVLWEIKKNDQVILPYMNYVSKTLNEKPENDTENCCEKIVKDFVQYLNNVIESRPFCDKAVESLSNASFNVEIQLWEISNEIREQAETKRRRLIDQSWTADMMIDIGKTFMSLVEIEADRSNATLEILCDYYGFMCGLQPLEYMPGIHLADLYVSQCDSNLCTINCAIANMLTDQNELNIMNPVADILEATVTSYLTEIGRLNLELENIIENYRNYVLDCRDEYVTYYKRGSVKQMYRSMEAEEEGLTEEEEDEDVKALLESDLVDVENMFIEWRYAVKSELDRLSWRIKIVKGRALKVLESLEKQMIDIFYHFHDVTIANYLKVNEGIDNLCMLFHSAVNNWSPITGNVVAEGCYVYVEKRVVDDIDLPSFEVVIEESIKPLCFTIEQLKIIMNQLASVAPMGVIGKRTLRFIIEDMAMHEFQVFPAGWNDLSSYDLRQLFDTAFGSSSTLYWKDFLLFCLDIPFPEVEDIIEHKERFSFFDKENKRTVSYTNYKSITFWFEEDTEYFEREKYYGSVKEFLFLLFKVNENEFDYEDFLLSFSKGKTSAIGFGKALSYLVGKCTVISDEKAYLEKSLTEYNKLLSSMVTEILDELIFEAVDNLHGVKIEELDETLPPEGREGAAMFLGQKTAAPEEDEATEHEEDENKSSQDKESQTVSLTELIYDQYIAKNKLYQWTTNISTDAIYYLLEKVLYRTFEIQDNKNNIKQHLLQTLNRLQHDGLIHLPSLMKETVIYTMFLWTRTFQQVSFSSLIKSITEGQCICDN